MYIAYSFFFFWYEKDPLQSKLAYSLSRAKCHAYIVDLIKLNTSVDEERNRNAFDRELSKHIANYTNSPGRLADIFWWTGSKRVQNQIVIW